MYLKAEKKIKKINLVFGIFYITLTASCTHHHDDAKNAHSMQGETKPTKTPTVPLAPVLPTATNTATPTITPTPTPTIMPTDPPLSGSENFSNNYTTYETGPFPSSLKIYDINADQLPDMIYAETSNNQVCTRVNLGNSLFSPPTCYTTGIYPYGLALADVNRDGLLDIITTDYQSNQLSIRFNNFNNQAGVFGAATIYPTGKMPMSVTANDINGDGWPDLVTADLLSLQISARLNNGDGTFGEPSTYDTGTGSAPVYVELSDLNHDGFADLVSTQSLTFNVQVRFNNGHGQFGAPTTYATAQLPRMTLLKDLNDDQFPDLIIAVSGNNEIVIRLNDGLGNFNTVSTLTTGLDPRSIDAADLNHDGKIDIISAHYGSGNLSIYYGKGANLYENPVTYNYGPNPSFVVAQDINNDTYADLMVSEDYTNLISVRLNQTKKK